MVKRVCAAHGGGSLKKILNATGVKIWVRSIGVGKKANNGNYPAFCQQKRDNFTFYITLFYRWRQLYSLLAGSRRDWFGYKILNYFQSKRVLTENLRSLCKTTLRAEVMNKNSRDYLGEIMRHFTRLQESNSY